MAAPGPQMQTQGAGPQQQGPAGQQPPQAVQQGDIDPISKFKLLLPRLKDALVGLYKVAGHVFRVNASNDSGSQPEAPVRPERFEKCLEDFCSICDQIEINLRLALEIHHQTVDSIRNTPLSVMIPKADSQGSQQEGQSYAQYLTTVRTQINFAKEIHDLLHESIVKLMDKTPPQQPQQQQQQQQQQQLLQQQQQQQQQAQE